MPSASSKIASKLKKNASIFPSSTNDAVLLNALVIFDLCDDFHVLSFFSQEIANDTNAFGIPNETGENHVQLKDSKTFRCASSARRASFSSHRSSPQKPNPVRLSSTRPANRSERRANSRLCDCRGDLRFPLRKSKNRFLKSGKIAVKIVRQSLATVRLTDFSDQEGEETIVDKDAISRFDHLNDVFVIDEQIVFRTFVGKCFIRGHPNGHAVL